MAAQLVASQEGLSSMQLVSLVDMTVFCNQLPFVSAKSFLTVVFLLL
jgi:hypothetical protein